MSIADLAPKTIQVANPKVVTLDIERLPGSATVPFWDLGAFKNRRIHADYVTEWPRTICAAWKWYGKKPVEFAAEWDDDGPETFLHRVWEVCDKADVLVGHNFAGFDAKKLNSEWRDLGLPAPTPYKVVDTLKEARKQFGDESMTLDALCRRLGLVAKTDKYDVETARLAVDGDKTAQRKIRSYNIGDIRASEALYDRLRGWLPSHPWIGDLDSTTHKCNQCGSTDLARNGTYLAVQIRYTQWRCKSCGANLRSAHHSRAANMRGVR